MRKTLLALFLMAAVGIGAWRFLAPTQQPKNPLERIKSAAPVEVVSPVKQSPTTVREIPIPAKNEVVRAQMEARFTDLKEEGRRIREMLLASDPNAAKAYQALGQRPDYREVIDRRHQIEAAWATAPDSEREGMLTEMNNLRQQGIGMLLAEIQRINSQPTAPQVLQQGNPGQLQLTPNSSSAPAPTAPAAPIVFQ